jgi:hypothetical protein
MTDQLREAARGVLSYPGPVNMTEEAHSTCTPDECYVTALRAALDAAPPANFGTQGWSHNLPRHLATPPAVDVERLRHVAEWVVREYDKTHLTHDVSYEKVAEAIDWLRIALDPKHPLYARLGDTR